MTRTKLDGTHADADSLLDAMRAGASGYLLTGAERDEIARAVLTVAAGRRRRRRPSHRRLRGSPTRPAGKLFPELSDREHDVLEHLARDSATTRLPRDRAAAVARARDRGMGDASR